MKLKELYKPMAVLTVIACLSLIFFVSCQDEPDITFNPDFEATSSASVTPPAFPEEEFTSSPSVVPSAEPSDGGTPPVTATSGTKPTASPSATPVVKPSATPAPTATSTQQPTPTQNQGVMLPPDYL